MSTQFVHLHCHTEYSLVDGILRIPELIAKSVELGMPAVAITDQSNLFGMVKFYQQAVAAKIKPIIGCDLWVANPQQPQYPTKIIVLCQNQLGYKNLTQIITQSFLHGQEHGKPIIDLTWLQNWNSGLIAIANPLTSDISQALRADNIDLASALLKQWQTIFNDRFYLGISRTGREGEDQYIQAVLKLARQFDCPVVATNEVCFMQDSDFDAHEARVCINEARMLNDQTRSRNHSKQQYFRSMPEMIQLFADIPSAIENTLQIAQRCNLILSLGQVHLPKYPVPSGLTPEKYLQQKAEQGFAQRFPQWSDDATQTKYFERLQVETQVINNMGFASYFLIVADFIAWAFANGVPVGPGRGSGAGSLVAYVLKITDIDPLQYDLLFERFLNPERVSMPDFDIDFCMEGRDRVIEYVAMRYGRDSVSQIITYGTMAARAVLRDVGRVLGFAYGFVDQIAKLIPTELGITLDKAMQQEQVLHTRYQQEDDVKTLIDLARKLEGITRNVGKHAGGVVIAPSKLTDFTPLYCEANDANTITQFDKDDVESIGLVKFDFLGLRTLTIINWAVQTIRSRHKGTDAENLDITKLSLVDKKTFGLLCATNTTAVFQLESRGMKDLIRRLHPDCFEDIVALVALFRPGPLQSGMVDDFINRKLGRAAIEYPHPALEPILKATYGVILYQEQVMQIAQVLAGYTLGAADLLRRAMGKKKPEEMAQQRAIFTQGAISNGINQKTATYIFDLMEKFAGYGFNKSHSAAYALVSYQTAWLKAHYPAEFMAAVLSADMAHTDKIVMMIEDCRDQGIKVVSPSINHSEYKFTVDEQNRIVYGLGAIKGLGESAIDSIVNARAAGKFCDLFDLCARLDARKVTRRGFEALIYAGALDTFGMHRAALMGNLDAALQAADKLHIDKARGQTDLFSDSLNDQALSIMQPAEAFPELSEQDRLAGEKATLGLYLTGHPINQYAVELGKIVTHKIINLRPGARGEKQIIAGLVMAIRTMQTKRGDRMAFASVEDRSGRQEIAVFSDLYEEARELLKKDNLIIVQGETKPDEYSGGVKMRALKIMSLAQARGMFAKKIALQLDASAGLQDDFVEQLKRILNKYQSGTCRVELSYKSASAVAKLNFGAEWLVTPADELIAELNTLAESKLSAIVSYSE